MRSLNHLAVQGARAASTVVLALDHHRGSEEHQPGEMFHDPELVDAEGKVDTLQEFRRNIARAGVEDHVIPIVAGTEQVAAFLKPDLGMVFIDGGHSLAAALADWRTFGTRIVPGGILAIHDVFPDAVKVVRPPTPSGVWPWPRGCMRKPAARSPCVP